MASLLRVRLMLWTNDVSATFDCCATTMGFFETACEKELQWGEVEKDGVAIMFARPDEHTPFTASQFTGSLDMATDDVESLWQSLKDTSHIFYGLETFGYGTKEFAVKDYNGYILQFGQDVPA